MYGWFTEVLAAGTVGTLVLAAFFGESSGRPVRLSIMVISWFGFGRAVHVRFFLCD